MADEIDKAASMLLMPRADWCASELERSSASLYEHADSDEIRLAAKGTGLMAATMRELRDELSETARHRDWIARTARYLLDQLTMSNGEVDAMYGKSDDLEGAATELRRALDAEESA